MMNNQQRYDNLNERGKNYFTWLKKRNGTMVTDYKKLNLEQLLDAVERWVKRADEEDAYLASRPVLKWKEILKMDIEEKILAEIKKEGGALGMKNLKQFGEESEIKAALFNLQKKRKIFMHRDGDIYTHKPKRRGAFTR